MSKARDLANAGTALTTVSATELGYLDGVTSAVQTQIDSKIGQATAINPTIVDAKGDIIAASAADTVARLAVGNNGETLVADSSTSTGLRWQSGVNRNAIINGGMDIWQRGTSFSGATNFYTADRWQYFSSSSTGRTITRQVTNDTTNLPTIQYCLRAARDSGNSNTSPLTIGYSSETVESIPMAGRTIVISFYARKGANYSASSDALSVTLKTGTGTDQNLVLVGYTGSATAISQTATLTTTWQRFSYSATLATNTNEFGFEFVFTPTGTAGAADYFELTGVQVEIGATPTVFKRAGGTLQGELAACQRYYYRMTTDTSQYLAFGLGTAENSTKVEIQSFFPVTMRTQPNTIDYANLAIQQAPSGSVYTVTSATIGVGNGRNLASTQCTVSSGLSSGTTYRGLLNGTSTTGYIGFSAEL